MKAWVTGQMVRLGMNRSVVYGMIAYCWRFIAGPVTMLLVATRFSPELQGYYYTFGSLIALQVFAELGLSNVVMQFASHEWSRLTLDARGRVTGEPAALSRLVSLGRMAIRWYLVAGLILSIAVGIWGVYFFSHTVTEGIHWFYPWIALCLLMGVNLALLPIFSLLQGCGQNTSIYRFKMVQGVLIHLSMWASILLGADLWTAAIFQTVVLVSSVLFIGWEYRSFFEPFLAPPTGPTVGWKEEIWPMQWKIAVSFLSGYFSTWVFTPLLFRYAGPVAAGQFGMTWTLVGAAAGVASMWILPRAPQFGVLIAQRNYAEADKLLARVWAIFAVVLAAGASVAWLFVYAVTALELQLAARMLSLPATALLVLGAVTSGFCSPASVYLRAHKREPYMWQSLAIGGLTVASAWFLSRHWGALGAAGAYAAVSGLVALPWGLWTLRSCREKWRSEENDSASTYKAQCV